MESALNDPETPAFHPNNASSNSLTESHLEELDRNGSSESHKITSESDADGTSSAEVDHTDDMIGHNSSPVKVNIGFEDRPLKMAK